MTRYKVSSASTHEPLYIQNVGQLSRTLVSITTPVDKGVNMSLVIIDGVAFVGISHTKGENLIPITNFKDIVLASEKKANGSTAEA